jgi:hypothetical protein
MNLQQQEQFYQMVTRLRANSRAASTSTKDDPIITEMVNGLIVSRPAKKIEYLSTKETRASEPIITDLQKSKAGSGTKYYDMSLPSTGDQVYKCGTHNFETKNLTEFNRHIEEHGSKAASVPGINKMKAIQEFINGRH